MTAKRIILAVGIAAAVAAALASALLLRPEPEDELRHSRVEFAAMGTRAALTTYGAEAEPEAAGRALSAVREAFDLVTKVCNVHDPESELSRLNREAGKDFFVCSPELWRVLVEARRAHRASSGAFDVTVKPLMDLWGFYRKRQKQPSQFEIARTLERVGLEKIEWDDARRAVRFKVSGMALDLGGIAKGYALDLAAAKLRELGIDCGVIDLGGNLYLLPKPPPGRERYRIGIRSPSGQGDSGGILELEGPCAVSTSGSYERFVVLEGVRCGHVVDPVTGEAPYLERSATVVAPTGIESDWLSSAAFLRGRELVPRLERAVPGAVICFTGVPR